MPPGSPVSYQEAQAIAAGITRDMTGTRVAWSNVAAAVAVYPHADTLGTKARTAIIRPNADVFFRPLSHSSSEVAVSGPPSALLTSGVTYIIPLHPNVNTLTFAGPTAHSLQINWSIP